jgi:hypothetical protein
VRVTCFGIFFYGGLTKRHNRGWVFVNRLLSIFESKRGEICLYTRMRLTCKMGG